MTTPDLSYLIPSKAKAWVGLVGSLLVLVVPTVLSAEQYLPWWANLLIGAVLVLLTALGIYHAPYPPAGAVLAPDTPAVQAAVQKSAPDAHGTPWD